MCSFLKHNKKWHLKNNVGEKGFYTNMTYLENKTKQTRHTEMFCFVLFYYIAKNEVPFTDNYVLKRILLMQNLFHLEILRNALR